MTAAVAIACLLVACSGDEALTATNATDNPSIRFDSYLGRQPASRALMSDIGDLRATGFGVCAYYTPNGNYAAATAPNFMYNQLVEYRALYGEPYITAWTYFPIKFWPNDYSTGAVDDQDNDSGGNPATGSGADRLSFFAYAPYAETATNGTVAGAPTSGITALTDATDTGDPLVSYTIAASGPDLTDAADILWGVDAATGLPHLNMTKQRTDETVAFAFRHALTRLRLNIRAMVDETTPGTTDPDADTRILVNSIAVSGNAASSARLNLNNTTAYTPLWQNPTGAAMAFTSPSATTINPVIYSHTPLYDRNGAAIDMSSLAAFLGHDAYWDTGDNFSHLPAGVTATAQSVFASTDNAYLFIPLTTTGAQLTDLTFNVNYTVVTRDPALVRNNPAGFSIVTNDISRTLSLATPFQGGKEYTVQLILGVESVAFDAAVSDWTDGTETSVYVPQNEEAAP